MAKYGKWIGGGLGWAVLGPLGGVLGFLVGSMFDRTPTGQGMTQTRTTYGDFSMSLLVLLAAVMKADGKVLKSELDFVKQYFVQSFGLAASQEAMLYLRDLLNQEIPLRDVANQIRQRLDHSSRLQLLHLLYGVSGADGNFHPEEILVIDRIAGYLGISQKDAQSIKSMFYGDTDAAYKILEVEAAASDDEIKKAYRRMAVKHHPDKVAYLGEDIKKSAGEKFRKINEAYEQIKKERGIK